MTTITIPIDVAEAAVEALGNFVSDHGWSDSDLQAMDNLDAYIARHKAIRAELAKPVEPEFADNSVDYWQQRGYLGSPDEWREACRLFRVRCSPEDVQRMGKLRAYVEDGLLIVSRPDSNTPTPAWHDAPTCDGLWLCNEGDDNPYRWTTHRVKFPLSPLLVGEDERWYGPIPQDAKAEEKNHERP